MGGSGGLESSDIFWRRFRRKKCLKKETWREELPRRKYRMRSLEGTWYIVSGGVPGHPPCRIPSSRTREILQKDNTPKAGASVHCHRKGIRKNKKTMT
jgi:hypothetical protein